MKFSASSVRVPAHALLGTALLLTGCGASRAADNPVEALIYSTMPSSTAHSPQMALDGSEATYFKSAYGMSDGDDLTILLSRPVAATSIRVLTGDAQGQDLLSTGFVEIAPDEKTFSRLASFNARGVVEAKPQPNTLVRALRIKVNRNSAIPNLVVREISIVAPDAVSHAQAGPGRGFSDISQAPDLAAWAKKAEFQMESFWADTAALLYTRGFVPPNKINVIYRTGPGVTPVAATGGGEMEVNSAWSRAHPEDTGLTVHEVAHAIQAYDSYNPVWLVEGIADYVRWVRFEPENFPIRLNPATAKYTDSYRTTAMFLAWCELNYDSRMVTKLSENVRSGTYKTEVFKTYTGKDVDTLWTEFIAAYKADPSISLISPPVALADRPRTLPVVAAGASTPVDLARAFNTSGFATDAKQFDATTGFDGGGASYSAALLGTGVTNQNVRFNIGKPDVANTVSARGQKIALPKGKFGSLWFLGAAVEGSQKAQTFVVNYADGTQTTLVQNVSDWFAPQSFPGETRAVSMNYRNMGSGTRDPRTFYAYSYGFPLDKTKEVASVTLPDNPNVRILGMSLGG